ncbi:T9SS type B sorting domain-containing protein [Flavobacterium sp. S87F.05.LMB.W.Kidney.N]|uniref:T9SS type B sorting domain-containing protein n=1 Tax=Flavobacterium sp. S87F.05.LMB.W.Kidney.N TaxID=1278758 RepID=UPI0010663227|nr:T9SS type B sorting domain-containing protein [Flavobacterium sp. S87F.05.LMB.W.Kidney.N]TDX11252.1 gliding motility-associated-like protein [Flavobacterium sp. S87F.05.LMB.W.Kidney.N]
MKIKLLIIFFFLSFSSVAQREASVWYFGRNAGIKFNADGSVTALKDGKLNTNEGCASIADSNGDLLFYTDGRTVWDKNHLVMPNADYLGGTGLLGDPSSTSSAMIIPKPGNPKIYYIFTLDEPHHENAAVYPNAFSGTYVDSDSGKTPSDDDGLNNGLNYSIVDLSIIGNNGSSGDVVSRNNPLITYDINPFGEEIKYKCSEKLTAVRDGAGNGFWVITQFSANFYAFHVTSSGVTAAPVKSLVLPAVPTFGYRRNAIGALKASPNGKKIAAAYDQIDTEMSPYSNYKGSVYLYDFDNFTGKVSNPKLLLTEVNAYGVEFSGDSNVLYASYNDFKTSQSLAQFDLLSDDIKNSKFLLFNSFYGIGALQLAPNNKIYYSSYFLNSLGVINNPTVLGAGCGFNAVGQILAEDKIHAKGLPPFMSSFFNAFFEAKHLCLGQETKFSLNASQTVTSVGWDFGDGSSSVEINPIHKFAQDGIYKVSVTAAGPDGTASYSREVIISKMPEAFKPNDLLVCDDNNDGFYIFDLTIRNEEILKGQDPALFEVNYFKDNVKIVNPAAFINRVAYQKEAVQAEVVSKFNNECKSTTDFMVGVFDMPTPNPSITIPALTICDNTSVGTENDGKVLFDLTQNSVNILKGQSEERFLISYYKDQFYTQLIADPKAYQNNDKSEKIYIKITNKDNPLCLAFTSFDIEVFELPLVPEVVYLKQCDDDTDGYSFFNLEEAIGKISLTSTNGNISFHQTIQDAVSNSDPISNTTTYRNNAVSTDKVFVRVSNGNGCSRTTELNLIVSTTQIPSSFVKVLTQCDDDSLGTNSDGIAAFNLSSVTNEILSIFPAGQFLDVTYYQKIEDALAEKNPIIDLFNYRNSLSPFEQKIFIRVDSRRDNDCLGLDYITLKVEPVPLIKSVERSHCDDNQDGMFAFDTSDIESELLNGLTNVTILYYDNDDTLLPSPLPNPFMTTSQTLKAVAVNANSSQSCSFSTFIKFTVQDLPEIFDINPLLTTSCDEEEDPLLQDGKFAFDTSDFDSLLLGGQKEMEVHYYDIDNNKLQNPLPNPFITGTQNIKAEVVNPKNSSCSASTIIRFVVNTVPKISLKGEELVCNNLSSFTKVIDAGISDLNLIDTYNYQWFFDGNIISDQRGYSLEVNKEGRYEVLVTDKLTDCERTRMIKVSASDKASEISVTVDQANTVSVLAEGKGDYIFALDESDGTYQSENIFQNVKPGIHMVYIKDKNGCGVVSKDIAVFGIPPFFTPNVDGYNDYWNVEGIDTVTKEKARIEIFDRYGKLLKVITALSQGWDGTFMGRQMPADDYWYVIKLEGGKVFKGHFALKR